MPRYPSWTTAPDVRTRLLVGQKRGDRTLGLDNASGDHEGEEEVDEDTGAPHGFLDGKMRDEEISRL